MALPELDVARIRRWCAGRIPERVRHLVQTEADFTNTHVTIMEVRPRFDGKGISRAPVARLRYTVVTAQWSLYWRDQHSKFHEYTRRHPTKTVQSLLDFLDSHEDPIFWG